MILLGIVGPWQIILIFIWLSMFILPVFAIINIVKNNFKENYRLIWILVVLLLPIFGTILYFVFKNKTLINN
jgi:hypothetical protein